MNPNQIIVIGGGNSINDLPYDIWRTLWSKFTICCNHSYKDITPTTLCCADGTFYKGDTDYNPETNLWNKYNPIHREKLSKLPLIVTLKTPQSLENPLKNTIFVKGHSHDWNREESVLKGFYCPSLTGHLALSLACFLLDFSGEIYLLGYDYNKSGKTHYYNHTSHRGVGFNDHYKSHNSDVEFGVYAKEKDVTIYNVSICSEINVFKKITPEMFLQQIKGQNYNQTDLRNIIKSKLT